MKVDTAFATSGPSFSLSSLALTQSGSATKAFQDAAAEINANIASGS